MKAPAALLVALCLTLWIAAAALGQAMQPNAETAKVSLPSQVEAARAALVQAPAVDETSYVLTWQKDPRFRERDPFQTVLHSKDSGLVRATQKMSLPRTPGEETAFVAKAESAVREASGALDEGDYAVVKERLSLVREMSAVPLVTQTAKDRMNLVRTATAEVGQRYDAARARAALTEALQLAARMQAYFDTGRYGEVVATEAAIMDLNNDEGLRNPEVAATAAGILSKCAELKRRAQVHIEFTSRRLSIDAVSHFPDGQSFAIVNGEVIGEGVTIAPELSLASIAGKNVTFNFKGESISLGLSQ